jgi:hypothetical protein
MTKVSQKAPPRASRMLIAKVIGFKAGRRKGWSPPRVDDLLRTVLAGASTIASRHVPASPGNGDRCSFINRATDYGPGGVLIEICSYVRGHIPESMVPDLSQPHADITVVELTDESGQRGEIVHSFRCLVLGQVMVMERVRGLAGAASIVQSLITTLIRRRTSDGTHPSLVLVDIVASELRDMIRAKGGVSRVTAKLVQGIGSEGSKYGAVLSDLRKQMSNAAGCAVTWEAAGTLDEDEAIDILNEAEDEALSAVTLHFKHGGSISDLTTYRERREVSVEKLSDGRIAVNQLEGEMRDYLDFLRKGGAIDSILEDGTVTRIKTIGKKK